MIGLLNGGSEFIAITKNMIRKLKKIGIAGCSYMAATNNGKFRDVVDSEGKHFTEIVAKHFGAEYCTFARGSASNTAIHLQVEQLLKENCDLILFSTTSVDRIEVRGVETFDSDRLTIFDLDYHNTPDRSGNDPRFIKKPKTYSQSIINILEWDAVESTKKTNIIKHWFTFCYDERIKAMQDACVVYSTLRMLEQSGVDYYCLAWGNYKTFLNKLYEFEPDRSRIIDDSNLDLSVHSWNYSNGDLVERRWHTTDLDQEIGARAWINFLQSNGYY